MADILELIAAFLLGMFLMNEINDIAIRKRLDELEKELEKHQEKKGGE